MKSSKRIDLVDDLDGSAATEAVVFSLDGRNFTINLCEANARALRSLLSPFIRAGRRIPTPIAEDAQQRRAHNRAIRTWARRNGYVVSARGRIPAAIVVAYQRQRGKGP